MMSSVASEAFFWGIVSAISLPIGSLLGILWQPKMRVNSSFMAFGAGALLFALTIELFGHIPHHVEEHGYLAYLVPAFGAILGGLLFDALNQILNNQGAFARNFSTAKKYLAKVLRKRMQEMAQQLSSINILRKIPPDQMAHILQHVKPYDFKDGETIFSQGEDPDRFYFIIEGKVEIKNHDSHSEKTIATLDQGEVFGEMGVMTGKERVADAKAIGRVKTLAIHKADFIGVMTEMPDLLVELEQIASSRADQLQIKSDEFAVNEWKKALVENINLRNWEVSNHSMNAEMKQVNAKKGAAFAIWLGILIDGIPESLVIGMLAAGPKGMSVAFIAGVFLANLPEAMSSSVSMKKNGMPTKKILLMWGSLTLLTGIGAFLGALLFPGEATGSTYYLILGIEGLAAGAMLTMIAETMMPEAFEQGGSVVGISTLLGFLAALAVKVFY